MKTTAERLQYLMDTRGLKQVDILRMVEPYCKKYKIKLGKSDLSQFVSGKVKPGQSKLSILGMALDVSEGWLMGLPVPMERTSEDTKTAPNDEDGLPMGCCTNPGHHFDGRKRVCFQRSIPKIRKGILWLHAIGCLLRYAGQLSECQNAAASFSTEIRYFLPKPCKSLKMPVVLSKRSMAYGKNSTVHTPWRTALDAG